jgi:recombination protein RecR
VVEESQDIFTIESTNEYGGTYHVLHGVISPIDGIGPKELGLDTLEARIRQNPVQEVIVATNPTVEGDTTALYIAKMLKDTRVKITRLASGLPVGGDLEYAGRLTLARSLKGRTPYAGGE